MAQPIKHEYIDTNSAIDGDTSYEPCEDGVDDGFQGQSGSLMALALFYRDPSPPVDRVLIHPYNGPAQKPKQYKVVLPGVNALRYKDHLILNGDLTQDQDVNVVVTYTTQTVAGTTYNVTIVNNANSLVGAGSLVSKSTSPKAKVVHSVKVEHI